MSEGNMDVNSAVFVNGVFVINAITDLNEFWLPLGQNVGYGRLVMCGYEREAIGLKMFVLHEVQSASYPIPHPVIASLGVLWRRQAAIAADQSIAAYREGLAG